MRATFRAAGTFNIPSRRLFVIYGHIVSGTLRKGMTMKLRANEQLSITLPIEAVEFVDHVGEKRSELALCTLYQNTEELALLKDLNIGNEIIEVEEEERA